MMNGKVQVTTTTIIKENHLENYIYHFLTDNNNFFLTYVISSSYNHEFHLSLYVVFAPSTRARSFLCICCKLGRFIVLVMQYKKKVVSLEWNSIRNEQMPLEIDQAIDVLNIKLIKLNIYYNRPWINIFCFSLFRSLEIHPCCFNHTIPINFYP
jgi:hypothetical protein